MPLRYRFPLEYLPVHDVQEGPILLGLRFGDLIGLIINVDQLLVNLSF